MKKPTVDTKTAGDPFARIISECLDLGVMVSQDLPKVELLSISWSKKHLVSPIADGESVSLPVGGVRLSPRLTISCTAQGYKHHEIDDVMIIHYLWVKVEGLITTIWNKFWFCVREDGAWVLSNQRSQRVNELVERMEIEASFNAIQ